MSVMEDSQPIEEPARGGFGLDGKGEMPSLEAIFEMIDRASGISDEEKLQIKEDVVKFRMETAEGLGNQATTAAVASGILAPHNLLFMGLVLFIALIIAFFVYKIIKAEKEKEERRSRKIKLKQEKLNKKTKKH